MVEPGGSRDLRVVGAHHVAEPDAAAQVERRARHVDGIAGGDRGGVGEQNPRGADREHVGVDGARPGEVEVRVQARGGEGGGVARDGERVAQLGAVQPVGDRCRQVGGQTARGVGPAEGEGGGVRAGLDERPGARREAVGAAVERVAAVVGRELALHPVEREPPRRDAVRDRPDEGAEVVGAGGAIGVVGVPEHEVDLTPGRAPDDPVQGRPEGADLDRQVLAVERVALHVRRLRRRR